MGPCWEGAGEVLGVLLSQGGQQWAWEEPRGIFLLGRAEDSAHRSQAGFVLEGQGWGLGTADTGTLQT